MIFIVTLGLERKAKASEHNRQAPANLSKFIYEWFVYELIVKKLLHQPQHGMANVEVIVIVSQSVNFNPQNTQKQKLVIYG